MKALKLLLAGFLLIGLPSWITVQDSSIDNCYIEFQGVDGLIAQAPDQLPEAAATPRPVNTKNGEELVSIIAGYRVLYNNDKSVPFVNLKVEKSAEGLYESDKKKLIDNLKYLTKNSSGMKSKKVIELEFNEQKIYGLSRNSIKEGSTLGTFIMFPGDGITVYFYFNNLKPDYRNFNSLKDYEKQRDEFMEKYTKYLLSCN